MSDIFGLDKNIFIPVIIDIIADTEPRRDNPIVITRLKIGVNLTLANITTNACIILTHVDMLSISERAISTAGIFDKKKKKKKR